VSIYEVSPRDGLQNESAMMPLEGKRRLIEALAAAGLTRIEITSFVSPKWVPQLADAEELAKSFAASPLAENVSLSRSVPQRKRPRARARRGGEARSRSSSAPARRTTR
jgi:hydroxymethylglutaryl-CoA lyase